MAHGVWCLIRHGMSLILAAINIATLLDGRRRTFILSGKTFRNNGDRDLHILQVRFKSSIVPLFRRSSADS